MDKEVRTGDGEAARRPPGILVTMVDGEPRLELHIEHDDHDTPAGDIASELMELAHAAPWILPRSEVTTPDPDEAENPSTHRLSSPAAVLLERHRPGPELAHKLARASLADADDATLVEIIAGWDREASWAAAQQARAVVELERRRAAGGPRSARSAVFEVEARLSITRYAAELRVTTAQGLDEFPAVADALAAGHIDLRKANVLLDEEWLTADERRAVHTKLLPDADLYTAPQLKEMMRHAALTASPAAARKRHAKAQADRHLRIDPAPDGMSFVSGCIRADKAETLRVVVDSLAVAAQGNGDTRTMDQRRADAFTDIFSTIAGTGLTPDGKALPKLQRRAPHIQVTVAGGTLLGLGDQPAELGGYGPISADLAREIAQDGTWRALFTDAATGEFVALSSKAYRPGADLTRTVVARDVTCVFMGCRTPAWRCEIDHIDSYDAAMAASYRRHPRRSTRSVTATTTSRPWGSGTANAPRPPARCSGPVPRATPTSADPSDHPGRPRDDLTRTGRRADGQARSGTARTIRRHSDGRRSGDPSPFRRARPRPARRRRGRIASRGASRDAVGRPRRPIYRARPGPGLSSASRPIRARAGVPPRLTCWRDVRRRSRRPPPPIRPEGKA